MESRDFVYWLQGFLELSDQTTLAELQVKMIREHIQLVLKKETLLQGEIVDLPTVLSC